MSKPNILIPAEKWHLAAKALKIVRKRARALKKNDSILFEESKDDMTELAMKINKSRKK